MKRLTLLIFLLVSVIGKSQTTYTWTGASSTSFSTPANWAPTTTVMPGSADNVVFNGTSAIDCIIDVGVDVNSMTITSGYTGTITCDNTFNHLIRSEFVQGGGTFIAPDPSNGGDLTMAGNMSLTGGIFTHNGGILNLIVDDINNCAISGAFAFNEVNVTDDGIGSSRIIDFGSTATITTLALKGSGKVFNFQGNVTIVGDLSIQNGSTGVPATNTGTFTFAGAGPLSITNINGTNSSFANRNRLPTILVNTSGVLTISNHLSITGSFVCQQGTIAGTHTLNLYGTNASITGTNVNLNCVVLQSGSTTTISPSSTLVVATNFTCTGSLNIGATSSVSIGTNLISNTLITTGSSVILRVVGNYTGTAGHTSGASNTISIGGVLRNNGLITTGSTSSLGVAGNFTCTGGLTLGANSIMTAATAFTSGVTVSTGNGGTINIANGYTYAAPINLGAGSTMTVGSTLSGTSAVTTGTGCVINLAAGFANNGGVNLGDGSLLAMVNPISGAGNVTAGNSCTVDISAANYGNSGALSIGDNSKVIIGGTHLSSGAITTGNSSTITIGGGFTGATSITTGTSCLFSTGSDLTASGSLICGASSTIDINGNYTCNGGLDLGASADLRVSGDFSRNNSSLVTTPTSSLTLDGTGSQNISASAATNDFTVGVLNLVGAGARNVNVTTAPIIIQNAVEVGANVTYATNGNMTLKSTNALTARVGPLGTGASVTGSVAKETVVPGGTTGWANLGNPGIVGETFVDWDTYYLSNFANGIPMMLPGCTYTPGSVGTWFKSVQGWNEPTVQYDTTLTSASSISPGTGYWVYVGDGQSSTNDLLLLNSGTLVQGNVPVSLTASGSGTNLGSVLLANPYASPISFSLFLAANGTATTGMTNGFSSWSANDNAYAVWNGSSGTNGATDVIAAGQGFYVVTNTSNSLNFTESCKSTANTSANPLLRPIANPLAAKLRLVSPNIGEQDETVIELNNTCSLGYDREHDMKKMKMSPGYPGYPGVYSDYTSIYSRDETGLEYAINTMPSDETTTLVPLGVEVTTQGTYTISPIDVESFASCLFLHDKQLNVYHDLKVKGDYVFTVNNVSPATRFELMLCASKSNGPVAITELVSNQSHVSITKGDNTIIVNTSFNEPTTATIEAYNILGQRILAPVTVQGTENTVRVPADANNEIVIVKVTTDSGVYTKKVVMK